MPGRSTLGAPEPDFGLAVAECDLGRLAHSEGDLAAARAHYAACLRCVGAREWATPLTKALDSLAALAAAEAQPARALRLAGASAALRDKTALRRTPREREFLEQALRPAYDSLNALSSVVWNDGYELPLPRALAEALGDQPA